MWKQQSISLQIITGLTFTASNIKMNWSNVNYLVNLFKFTIARSKIGSNKEESNIMNHYLKHSTGIPFLFNKSVFLINAWKYFINLIVFNAKSKRFERCPTLTKVKYLSLIRALIYWFEQRCLALLHEWRNR